MSSVHLIIIDSTQGQLRYEMANRDDPCVAEWMAWPKPSTVPKVPGRPMTQFAVWTIHPQTRAPVRPDPDKIDGCEVLAALTYKRPSTIRLNLTKLRALPDTSDTGVPRTLDIGNSRIAFWEEHERALAAQVKDS